MAHRGGRNAVGAFRPQARRPACWAVVGPKAWEAWCQRYRFGQENETRELLRAASLHDGGAGLTAGLTCTCSSALPPSSAQNNQPPPPRPPLPSFASSMPRPTLSVAVMGSDLLTVAVCRRSAQLRRVRLLWAGRTPARCLLLCLNSVCCCERPPRRHASRLCRLCRLSRALYPSFSWRARRAFARAFTRRALRTSFRAGARCVATERGAKWLNGRCLPAGWRARGDKRVP